MTSQKTRLSSGLRPFSFWLSRLPHIDHDAALYISIVVLASGSTAAARVSQGGKEHPPPEYRKKCVRAGEDEKDKSRTGRVTPAPAAVDINAAAVSSGEYIVRGETKRGPLGCGVPVRLFYGCVLRATYP